MNQLKRFKTLCNTRVERIFQFLIHLENSKLKQWQDILLYPLMNGGKRLRAMLCIATGMMYNIPDAELDLYAAALEMIHAYSLIHDDLPAMDNDNLRRGKPTCHVAFGEGNAILAGDALNAITFELLSGSITPYFNSVKRIKMIQALAEATGFKGMCAGQYLDLNPEQNTKNLEGLEQLHHLKTGKLIEVAIKMPLIYAEAPKAECDQLLEFAKILGLVFQIQDDILDIEGASEQLGKTPQKDQALRKFTYPAILGLEGAKQHRDQQYQKAKTILKDFDPEKTELLLSLLEFAVTRDH